MESRLVTGPSDILFAGMYVYTFQPGNFTGCGSEGVKYLSVSVCFCLCVVYNHVGFLSCLHGNKIDENPYPPPSPF